MVKGSDIWFFMSHELKKFEWISGTLDKVFVPQSADPFQVDMCFSLPVLKTVKLTIFTILSFYEMQELWSESEIIPSGVFSQLFSAVFSNFSL